MKTIVKLQGAATLLSFVWALTACTSFGKLVEKPNVKLDTLKIQSPTVDGATLVFGLAVENPNSVALEVDELVYDLEFDGRALSSGKLEQGARVPAKSTATVEIPVAVKYSDLFSSVIRLLTNETSPYRIKGSARVGPFEVPFDKVGEVKLPRGT